MWLQNPKSKRRKLTAAEDVEGALIGFSVGSNRRIRSHIPLPCVAALLHLSFGIGHETHISSIYIDENSKYNNKKHFFFLLN